MSILNAFRKYFLLEEKELQRSIEEHWPLKDVRIQKIFQEKAGRRVLSIKSREGRFVVKIADHSKTRESIRRDTLVLDFLRKHNFNNVPFVLETGEGAVFEKIDNRFIYIMELIEGRTPESTDENWFKLGKVLADLHFFDSFPDKTSFGYDSARSDLLEDSKKYSFGKEYWSLVESLPDFSGLPASLINTDIGLHNSIIKSDGSLILIDWDDAGNGPMVLDLGYPLICQCVTSLLQFRKSKALSFYQGYASMRQITEEERKAIFDAGLFFALLYIKYGRIRINWNRIKYAVRNKDMIKAAINL
jgi:Ser/Thr protein kinase RdoA (MazF antagonist)